MLHGVLSYDNCNSAVLWVSAHCILYYTVLKKTKSQCASIIHTSHKHIIMFTRLIIFYNVPVKKKTGKGNKLKKRKSLSIFEFLFFRFASILLRGEVKQPNNQQEANMYLISKSVQFYEIQSVFPTSQTTEIQINL